MRTSDRLLIWTRRGLDLALVLLAVACLLTILVARVVPMTGRPTLVVAGGSMVPALDVGSALIVEPVDPGALRVGDIVSLRSGPQRAIFTHRITRLIDRDGALWVETKGDANAEIDPSITPAGDVIGRVSVSVPRLGYAIALLSAPVGILFAVSLGSLLLFASWMLDASIVARRRPVGEAISTDPQVGSADLDAA